MKIDFDGGVFQLDEYPQPEDIRYSKDFKCECGKIDFLAEGAAPVGYCNTNNGYMAVFECPHCFEKSRFHIQTTGRYDLNDFKFEVALMLDLQYARQKKDEI